MTRIRKNAVLLLILLPWIAWPNGRDKIQDDRTLIDLHANSRIAQTAVSFVHGPIETEITPSAVTLQWKTDVATTAVIKYGETEAYELGEIIEQDLAQVHTMQINGLQPATIYYCQVNAQATTGETATGKIIFSTASDESSGEINVYFTKSVDASYADPEEARGNVDLANVIIDRINRTQYTLDISFYSFTHVNIAFAIKRAKERGVSVRMIYERDNESDEIKFLRDVAHIPIINDTFGANSGGGAMHDKFVICDYRDKSTGADDWLWVGSANATYGGSSGNAENMLLIQDEALCATYTREFNEMWGSDTETPNSGLSRFGSRKQDNTPHRFNINGVWIEQYMSPSDNTESHIINAIATAEKSLYFCILAFTSNGISKAMRDKYYSIPDFWLRGVFEAQNVNINGSEYPYMAGTGTYAWSPPADVHKDVIPYYLHHKYMIIDAALPNSDPVVVTGSHNWTYSANSRNDENTLIIHDRRITNLYLQEFAARYHESGGTGDIITGVNERLSDALMPTDYRLEQNYPNPFNESTFIPVHLPSNSLLQKRNITLVITDVLGRTIRQYSLAMQNRREQNVLWDGKDENGKSVPSGIYFAGIKGDMAGNFIKMAYIR